MRPAGLVLGILLLFSSASTAFAMGLEVAVGGWQQNPQGKIFSDVIAEADALNLEKDLKYGSEIRVFGRAKIDMPSFLPDIYLMATPMAFEGTGSKDITFSFGGGTFNAGVPFFSKVTLDHYDIALFYGLPFISSATAGVFNLEFGVNARIVDFKAEFDQEDTATSGSESFVLTVPMLYLGAQLRPVDWLSLEAEGRGVTFRNDYFYSVIGRVKVKPIGPLFVAGGWRYDDVDIEEETVRAKVQFSGPFLEAGLEL